MKRVRVIYHGGDDGWWADSPDLPGWIAAADSFEEVREQAISGVHEFVGDDCLIHELTPAAISTGVERAVGKVSSEVFVSGAFSVVRGSTGGVRVTRGEIKLDSDSLATTG